MSALLVTGAAGFIGSCFVRHALRAEPETRVVSLDNLSWAGRRENLDGLPDDGRHVFIEGDVRDGALVRGVLREHRIDSAVHFAAETHVDRSIDDPGAFVSANVVGTLSLLEAVRAVWQDERLLGDAPVRFHQVGTDEVYGDLPPTAPPSREGDPYRPSSPYAASKAGADHLALAWARTYGLPVSLHLASNTYGPRQLPEKLIPAFIARALAGEPLPLYGDGLQIRDWLYVEDHCAAALAALRRGRPGRVYNVGGGEERRNRDLVAHLCALLDEALPGSPHAPHGALVRRVADRPGHDHRYALDCARAREELGWRPAVNLDDGLRRTVRWYLDHRERLARTRDAPDWRAWEAHQHRER